MKTWQDLPSEMKEKVVFHCTPITRSSLSACSKLENQMVKNVRLKKAKYVDIRMTAEELYLWAESERVRDSGSFKTFADLQAAILVKMKKVNYIKKINIISKERSEKSFLNMLTAEDRECCRLRKIEEICIESDIYEEVVDILRQVEPIYLRKVKITSNISKEELYEMPQITNAEEVIIQTSEGSMRESQLLNLEASYVKISHINFPVNKFIKKCILEANVKSAEFDFTFADESLVAELLKDFGFDKKELHNVIVLETLYPHLKLEMKLGGLNLKGSIVFDSEKTASLFLLQDQYMLRVIEELRVNYTSPFLTIDVTRKHQSSRSYEFKSLTEAQEKLDEILENVDFITNFYIWNFEGLLFQPRKKQLMVRGLNIEMLYMKSSCMAKNLLDKIEPGYLGSFRLMGNSEMKELFDIPQIIHANSLAFRFVVPRDDQILKLKAEDLRFEGSTEEICLTPSGLNKYIKKCLLDLDKKNYGILVSDDHSMYEWNEEKLFEDLEYTKTQGEDDNHLFVIKSDFPEYVLVVSIDNVDLIVTRELRNNNL